MLGSVTIGSADTVRALKGVPVSFKLAGQALLKAEKGRVLFILPDGTRMRFDAAEPGPEAEIHIHNYAFAKKSLAGGDVGFAEAYMDGDWSTPDLTAVLEYFSANFDSAGGGKLARGARVSRWLNLLRHFARRNSRAGARRNILAHYDLGNAFYESWLDPSMTYSSALFETPNMSLERGQYAKYEAIADAIGAEPGQRILEIGCGWGGFAEHAAKVRGAHVTCLTISDAQKAYAETRIQREGLSDRVDIRLEDYRDHKGQYDGIASIEMFEAVGEAYWPSYFEKIHSSLKEGGRAALQIITIENDLFTRYRKRADFIQRYIFPGGMLPSELALKNNFEKFGLNFENVRYFGSDYAETLRLWAKAFNEKWAEIEKLNFDDAFHRMWNFYLSYCEAGFRNGRIDVGQFTVARR